mgnify:CR=1 FL=1
MRNDHELLHRYLGDEMFDEMGHAYVEARPSEHPNLRWFSQGLPDFLKSAEPYCDHPVLSDLAALEKALNDAFDAAEARGAGAGRHGRLCAGSHGTIFRFQPHPSACRLDLATNAAADLAGAQERRDAAGCDRAGRARAPPDLAAGHHADVPRACQRRRR